MKKNIHVKKEKDYEKRRQYKGVQGVIKRLSHSNAMHQHSLRHEVCIRDCPRQCKWCLPVTRACLYQRLPLATGRHDGVLTVCPSVHAGTLHEMIITRSRPHAVSLFIISVGVITCGVLSKQDNVLNGEQDHLRTAIIRFA